MAQPTREQFDTAAKKVMASAPEGLSREQFYSLIDKELEGAAAATAASKIPHTLALGDPITEEGKSGQSEPDTFWGGFGKSLKDQILHATVDNSGLQGAAHPQSMGDFLSLVIPSGTPNMRVAAGNVGRELKAGAAEAPKLRNVPGSVLKRISEYWNEAPETTNTRLFNQKPLYSQMEDLPAASSDMVRQGGSPFKATGQESVLDRAMAQKSKPPVKAPTTPDAFVGGKRYDPTKSNVLSPDEQDSMLSKLSALDPRISSDTTAPLAATGKTTAAQPDLMDQLLGKLGGKGADVKPLGQPRVLSLKPETIAPEQWDELRRYYGADELSRLTGKTREEILQLAPGPSRTPLGVEDKLNQDPDGLFKFLRDNR